MANNNQEYTIDKFAIAAKRGDKEVVIKCLAQGLDANQKTSKGWTPLMYAVMGHIMADDKHEDYLEIIRLLVELTDNCLYSDGSNIAQTLALNGKLNALGVVLESGKYSLEVLNL